MGSRNNKHLCENLGSMYWSLVVKIQFHEKKWIIIIFFGNFKKMFTISKEKSTLSKKWRKNQITLFFRPDLLDFTRNLHAKSKIASGLPEKIYNIWSTLQKLTFFPVSDIFLNVVVLLYKFDEIFSQVTHSLWSEDHSTIEFSGPFVILFGNSKQWF